MPRKTTKRPAIAELTPKDVEYRIGGRAVTSDGLTAKQENFCVLMATGRTVVDSYRTAYEKTEIADATAYGYAYSLLDNPKIQDRIRVLIDQKANWTISADRKWLRQHVLNQLVRESLNDANNGAARVKALELLGKTDIAAMFTETPEAQIVRDVTTVEGDLMERIKDIMAKMSPSKAD